VRIDVALPADKFVCATFLTKCEVLSRRSWDIDTQRFDETQRSACFLNSFRATNDPFDSRSTSDQSQRNIAPSLRTRLLALKIYTTSLRFRKFPSLLAITKLSLVWVPSKKFAVCAMTYWHAFQMQSISKFVRLSWPCSPLFRRLIWQETTYRIFQSRLIKWGIYEIFFI